MAHVFEQAVESQRDEDKKRCRDEFGEDAEPEERLMRSDVVGGCGGIFFYDQHLRNNQKTYDSDNRSGDIYGAGYPGLSFDRIHEVSPIVDLISADIRPPKPNLRPTG